MKIRGDDMTDVKYKAKSRVKEKFAPIDIVLLAVLIFYVLVLAVLFYWAIVTSIKSQDQFYIDKIAFPNAKNYDEFKIYNPLLEGKPVWNFGKIFDELFIKITTKDFTTDYVDVPTMIIYTILYAVGCAFFNTLTQMLTAYACAKFPCKISSILYNVAIVVMIIPIVGSLPAEIQLAKDIGIHNSLWGQWIMKANYLGIYFLVFFSTFKSLPNTYIEAAKIDGAGNFYIMTRVCLPLVRNEFLTIFLINFIAYWNDYQIPLLYLPTYPTIAYAIYKLAMHEVEGFETVPMRMAGAVAMLVPILVIFITFNKRLLGNLTVGGIKG